MNPSDVERDDDDTKQYGAAFTFSPEWRTTKSHSSLAMMDCYRLLFFAFSQPRTVSVQTPPVGADNQESAMPPLTSKVGLDALYSRHMRSIAGDACSQGSERGSRDSVEVSPLMTLPMLAGTVYDSYGDDCSLLAHIPPAFVEELFAKLVVGGEDISDDEQSANSSRRDFSAIESFHYDSERAVGCVLFRNGYLGEQCYLAHHLSTFSLPTKAALRRGLREGAPISVTDGIPTVIPVTLHMEFGYCLPFINPCMLHLHRDVLTINRNLLRTFPMPFGGSSNMAPNGRVDSTKPVVVGPVENGKDTFANHLKSCLQKAPSSEPKKPPLTAPSAASTATMLSKVDWITRTLSPSEDSGRADKVCTSVTSHTISLPHNNHWYHGVQAHVVASDEMERSGGEAGVTCSPLIYSLLRTPVIPQALVECLFALNDGAFESAAMLALCQVEGDTSIRSALSGRKPPVGASVLDLWVGYVCRYVLWKPIELQPCNNSATPDEEAPVHGESEGADSRAYYDALLVVLCQQATSVQTLTAQSLVYMVATEALSLMDHKGAPVTFSLGKLLQGKQVSPAASTLVPHGADPIQNATDLLASANALILGSSSRQFSHNPCMLHLHQSFSLPFQQKGKGETNPRSQSPPSSLSVPDKSSVVVISEMFKEYLSDPIRHSVVAFVQFKLRLQLDATIAAFIADIKIHVARKIRLESALENSTRLKEVEGALHPVHDDDDGTVSEALPAEQVNELNEIRAHISQQLKRLLDGSLGGIVGNDPSDKTHPKRGILTKHFTQKSREIFGVSLADKANVPAQPFFSDAPAPLRFLASTSTVTLAFNAATNAEILRREGLLQTGHREEDNVYVNEPSATPFPPAGRAATKHVTFQDPLDVFSQVALLFDKHAASGSPSSMAMVTCPPVDFFQSSDEVKGLTTQNVHNGEVFRDRPYVGLGCKLRAEAKRYQGPLGIARLLAELFWDVGRLPILVLGGFFLLALFLVSVLPADNYNGPAPNSHRMSPERAPYRGREEDARAGLFNSVGNRETV